MQTNIYYLFLVLLGFEFFTWAILAYLNKTKWSNELPSDLKNIYDEEKYKKSMQYEKVKYDFNKITNFISAIIIFIFVAFWFFWQFYDFLKNILWFDNFYINIIFILSLFFAQSFLNLFFSYFYTFKIEEKFWFNKMTKQIFFTDFLKKTILWGIILWIIFSLLNLFYLFFPNYFWIFSWWFMIFLTIFIMMFYSSVIVPIFNKQTPLEDWSLKQKINDFASKVWFTLENIFVIDWSKRSTKANAYFSWFWPKKRIVLFDTLISDLTDEELVAVLAHEIGHYKEKHTLQMLFFSIFQTGIIFFVLSLVLKYDDFSFALGTNYPNFAIWLLAFFILFSPLSMILGVLWNILSRKNEYEADRFAAKNYDWKYLQNALIKLSKNNLSNLKPHKAYEFFYYSHPTVLKRLKALEK